LVSFVVPELLSQWAVKVACELEEAIDNTYLDRLILLKRNKREGLTEINVSEQYRVMTSFFAGALCSTIPSRETRFANSYTKKEKTRMKNSWRARPAV
jgi:hypothetical protein